MKVVTPKPFTFKGGEKAVLLLHGFTGNTADVRMLGRYLNERGYTCHAPQYKGHGVPPEELVHFGPDDWWKDVQEGYQFLKDEGYENRGLRPIPRRSFFIEIRLHCTCKGNCTYVCTYVHKK